jgi:hypothetical protein
MTVAAGFDDFLDEANERVTVERLDAAHVNEDPLFQKYESSLIGESPGATPTSSR